MTNVIKTKGNKISIDMHVTTASKDLEGEDRDTDH